MAKQIFVQNPELPCFLCKGNWWQMTFKSLENNTVYYKRKCCHCHMFQEDTTTTQSWITWLQFNDSRRDITQHHRHPRSQVNIDGWTQAMIQDKANIAYVSNARHQAWHFLFQNRYVDNIVEELNGVWIPPDKKLIIENINIEFHQLKHRV